MKSLLMKWLMPSSEKLAGWAAEGIQSAVNKSDKADQIVKYNEMAAKAAEVQKWVTDVLADGRIDDMEKDQIAEKIRPLFDKLTELL